MAVQLFVPSFRIEECLTEIRECLEKGWTGLGFKTVAFEEAWKAYTGLPNAHFLSSNTVGLHLAFKVLKSRFGWEDGDEVITTPLTFISTNHAILHANLNAVFADVDESLCLDPESVASRITPRTRAVIFVGVGGNTGQYPEIVKLCKENGLALILDAAHMAGTRLNGRHVGHEADAVVYSFQAVKNLPTADSGMICFKEKQDDEKVRKITWLGINKDTYSRTAAQGAYKWMYDVEDVGYKYHGNSIMAAIGLVQLKYLDRDNAYRRQLATWYRQCLSEQDHIRLVDVSPGCESSTHLLQLRVSNRDSLMLALNEHQIYPGVHYRDNTEYSMYSYASGRCPKAAKASQEIISLPLHLGLTHADITMVSEQVIHYAHKEGNKRKGPKNEACDSAGLQLASSIAAR
jgi:dTDP-4-amino-4,6-dideoxygalactose transaminase